MHDSIPDDIRGLVERVCAEMGLDAFAPETVERWVRMPPQKWPKCCFGGCDPCNDTFRAAARRVLQVLEDGGS